MEFDKSKVYTALNADELKPGSKVIVSDYLASLKLKVKTYQEENVWIITDICSETLIYRFRAHKYDSDYLMCFALAYLIEEPQSLYKCYLNSTEGKFMYTNIPISITHHVYAEFRTEEEAKDWCTEHQKFVEVAKAWEEGKQIQFLSKDDNTWKDCADNKPSWSTDYEYRIKPKLYWFDLKVGDVLKNAICERIVIEKDYGVATNFHILAGSNWMSDDDLSVCTLIRRAKDV